MRTRQILAAAAVIGSLAGAATPAVMALATAAPVVAVADGASPTMMYHT